MNELNSWWTVLFHQTGSIDVVLLQIVVIVWFIVIIDWLCSFTGCFACDDNETDVDWLNEALQVNLY